MAWYQDGDWNDLRVDRTGHLLHQMCYAINEREDAVGRTKTTWGSGRGSLPTADKFDGIRLDRRCEVIDMMRDAIPSLIDTGYSQRFVKSDGTDWTETSLLEAAGYGDEWIAQDGLLVEDLDPYLQMRAVLEKLIYVLADQNSTRGYTDVVRYAPFTPTLWRSTMQDAHDAAVANVATENDVFLNFLAHYAARTRKTGSVIDYRVDRLYGNVVTTFGQNTIKPAVLKLNVLKSVTDIWGGSSMTLLINGAEYVLNNASTASDIIYVGKDVPIQEPYESGGKWHVDVEVELKDWTTTYPFSAPIPASNITYIIERYIRVDSAKVVASRVESFTYG